LLYDYDTAVHQAHRGTGKIWQTSWFTSAKLATEKRYWIISVGFFYMVAMAALHRAVTDSAADISFKNLTAASRTKVVRTHSSGDVPSTSAIFRGANPLFRVVSLVQLIRTTVQ
jgi:hypothetical protein